MTRLTTPFGAKSTAAEVLEGIDLTGKRAVVTGGASGIGIETARAFAGAGADVTLAVRNEVAGAEAAADIASTTGSTTVASRYLDLQKRETLAAFADAWDGPLDILVNNAGIMATPFERTPDGNELQFANNHLGHFALAVALHDALASARDGARIVSLSSTGHLASDVVFDDLAFERREYDPWLGYGQSKTANVLFAVGVSQKWADDGITANAVHPGGIMTNLQRHLDPDFARKAGWVSEDGTPNPAFKTTEQGASTSVLVAASPLVDGISGRYFEDANEALPHDPDGPRSGVAAYAVDPSSAERLWAVSLDLTR
ncbi:NAD(P)-dependent dehydrogenase (short-subunit alcohol dehydrogenase family) [Frondihabitans sp. PhB188]|uniref:SDR family NAD(P)-dependent oxidoreductase n=1 Tax=Frondihabitans sp. PhB188 TaxID=2485200 RepID=UPI000F46C21E|nr:SDR family NAD(P)-dependent oxidoreductase [Frondihabitans sp. PhB188]ROQ39850.1 NAD(P)-dependent dehydrogenase (short-subunit alcohol dehydrogenase family) [Frondihabitans sp. PhB188]